MSKKLTTEEFKKRIKECFGNKYEVLSKYENNHTKVKIKCNICNNIFYKSPNKMMGKTQEGCYICSKKNRYKTKETLQNEVDLKFPKTYEIIGDYIRARTSLVVLNKKCNHSYLITPDNLLRGKGCPRCSIKQSSYMDIVERYFQENGISYEKEKRFDGCKHTRTLPFDYYIKELNCCLEVDGEFHYVNRFSPRKACEDPLEEVKTRDKIKTEYCKENGIKLIRLPYYEKDNFCKILDSELHVNTEITNENKMS